MSAGMSDGPILNGPPVQPGNRGLTVRLRERGFLRIYMSPRNPWVRVNWHLGRWPGHLRLVTPWREFGLIWLWSRNV